MSSTTESVATAPESDGRLLGGGLALLPRVNLLPPEIGERRAFQRVQLGLGAAVLGAIAVVALLVVSANHGVTKANDDLAAAQTQNTTLHKQLSSYSNVNAIYAAAADAQAQLSTAMSDEVRFSQLLNDLSLSIPSSTWVTSVTISEGGAATPAVSGAATPTIGTFSVVGVGFSHNDVATWLESIAALPTYSDPYFSASTEALLGTRKIVNFSSTANITAAALSGRYTQPVGG